MIRAETIRLRNESRANGVRNKDVRGSDIRCIAAHADYRREDFIFPRTQSLAMRDMEWESRLKPIRPRLPNFVANLAFAIFA
jgi:hypothetical protein